MQIEDVLYDELMLKILSFVDLRTLHMVGQVNRRWSRLSRKSWKSLKRIKFYTLFNQPELPKGKYLNKALHYVLKKCGRNLKSLNMFDPEPEFRFVKINERTFMLIGKYCPNLEEINFTDVLILNDLLHALVKNLNCSKLKSAILKSSFNHYCVIHDGLSALYSACTSVRKLNISNSLNARVRDCEEPWPSTLVEVHMDNAWALTSYSLMTLSKCCPNLTVFSMNGHGSGMDPGLEIIFQKCNLTKLSLINYPGSLELGLQISHMPNLTELYLGGSTMVCDDVISGISYSCPKLEILNLDISHKEEQMKFGCFTDKSLLDISKYVPNLKQLMLNNRTFITDDGLTSVMANGNLSKITVRGCPKISDVSLQVLSRFCSKLKHIDVTSARFVTNEGVINLCKNWFCSTFNDTLSFDLDIYAEDLALNLGEIVAYFQSASAGNLHEFTYVQAGVRKTVCFYSDILLSMFD